MESLVIGPCAEHLPGANGLAHMNINGNIS
jgi:hypothetical protein